jgi:hypothetical protein
LMERNMPVHGVMEKWVVTSMVKLQKLNRMLCNLLSMVDVILES